MEHIAIDLGSKESQVCVRTSTGDIVEERRCGTNELEGWLSSRAPGRVIVETCTEAFRLADTALRLGKYFGTSPEIWLDLQSDHGLRVARRTVWSRIESRVRSRVA